MSSRYRLEHTLGHGGMGTISRAYDRLTGTQVALKQLTLALEEGDDAENLTLRRALAEEFRLLATLRHPYIVSVLDYGFMGPTAFYTMELLGAANTLTHAAQGQPFAVQLALLTQLLQTLEYLRRHQVVHRDLKPDNVLVQNGQIKVLDFGLAVLEGHTSDTAGSLFYMAPEVLQGQPATHAADLFAVGVLAYEILAGQRPFEADDYNALVQQICEVEPDYAGLGRAANSAEKNGPTEHTDKFAPSAHQSDAAQTLQPVLARLLAKDPVARFATAGDALVALVQASGQAMALETHAARASFLQAAQFVGRSAERAQLAQALTAALAGQGSAWLIGGESGVGKSRLVEELRIQALVQGALVWPGQALDTAGQPAQVWRMVLRWLALLAAPDDVEAGVLQPFVPDLDTLLERPIPALPALEGPNAETRFFATVIALLRRVTATQPLVLILEDLHWIGPQSLSLLTWVARAAPELRLLVVGLYRDDERPTLPAALPGAQIIALKRFAPEHVAALASAILGQSAATLPHLTTFLYQQTEGNAFFLVEVLRTLAEETGLLSQVAQMTLPTHVLAEGIQQVVQRRLQRLNPADYAVLELAALDGRALDLPVLQYLAPDMALRPWLNRCAEAAVLEPEGVAWRFAHEQLRHGALRALPAARRLALHQQWAESIEHIYAPALDPHLNRLVYHYGETALPHKQRHYLQRAARAERAAFDNASAVAYYNQLAPLLTNPTEQLDLHLERGAALEFLGRWDEAEADYRVALALSPARSPALARSQQALGVLASQRNQLAAALDWLAQAQTNWIALHDRRGEGRVQIEMGLVHWLKGDFAPALAAVQAGLALARVAADSPAIGLALNTLGRVAHSQGDYATAHTFHTESLALRRAAGDKQGVAASLNNLGLVAVEQGDFTKAQTLHEESLALKRELGDRPGMANSLNNLGVVAHERGDLAAAQTLYEEGLALRQALGDQWGAAVFLNNLGLVALEVGDYVTAQARYETSLALRQQLGDVRGQAYSQFNLGFIAAEKHAYAEAQALCAASLRQAHALNDKRWVAFNLAGLVTIWLGLGDPHRATRLAAAAEALWAALHSPLQRFLQRQFDRALTTLRATLGEADFTVAWAAGTAMTLEAAVAEALGEEA